MVMNESITKVMAYDNTRKVDILPKSQMEGELNSGGGQNEIDLFYGLKQPEMLQQHTPQF